jgi:hypothetical protein
VLFNIAGFPDRSKAPPRVFYQKPFYQISGGVRLRGVDDSSLRPTGSAHVGREFQLLGDDIGERGLLSGALEQSPAEESSVHQSTTLSWPLPDMTFGAMYSWVPTKDFDRASVGSTINSYRASLVTYFFFCCHFFQNGNREFLLDVQQTT